MCDGHHKLGIAAPDLKTHSEMYRCAPFLAMQGPKSVPFYDHSLLLHPGLFTGDRGVTITAPVNYQGRYFFFIKEQHTTSKYPKYNHRDVKVFPSHVYPAIHLSGLHDTFAIPCRGQGFSAARETTPAEIIYAIAASKKLGGLQTRLSSFSTPFLNIKSRDILRVSHNRIHRKHSRK